MDDKQTIRLECLSLAIKGGAPAHEWRRTAEVLAAWVIGTANDPDALADAIEQTKRQAKWETIQRPDGYLINKDFGGWYFTAPGAYGSPSTHWATEAEAIAHAQTHKAMASAWEPEDPQMGELAHPKPTIAEVADRLDQADIDFDMRVAATIRRLNRSGLSL